MTATKAGYAVTTFGAQGPADSGTPIDVAERAVVPGIELRMRKGAVISGRVVSGAGDPVLNARILAEIATPSSNGQARTSGVALTRTDDTGEYRLAGLPEGTFFVRVNTAVDGNPPPRYYPGLTSLARAQPIAIGAGEERSSIDFTLPTPPTSWPQTRRTTGVITGRVLDDAGDPVEGVALRVLQLGYESGQRRLVAVQGPLVRATDDTGRYLITRLQPGQYIVKAPVNLSGYAPMYFSQTAESSDAQPIPVGESAQVTNIDLRLTRARTATVLGIALNAAGNPSRAGIGSIALVPSWRSGALDRSSVENIRNNDGTFEFRNVLAGEYVIQVVSESPPDRAAESEFAFTLITVGGADISGLVLRTSRGSTLSGRITLEGEGDPYFDHDIDVTAIAVDPDRSPGRPAIVGIRPDLGFGIGALTGPRLFRLTRAPEGWALKAVLLNGVDVTDWPIPFDTPDQSIAGLEVVLTNRTAKVSGRVLDVRDLESLVPPSLCPLRIVNSGFRRRGS